MELNEIKKHRKVKYEEDETHSRRELKPKATEEKIFTNNERAKKKENTKSERMGMK